MSGALLQGLDALGKADGDFQPMYGLLQDDSNDE